MRLKVAKLRDEHEACVPETGMLIVYRLNMLFPHLGEVWCCKIIHPGPLELQNMLNELYAIFIMQLACKTFFHLSSHLPIVFHLQIENTESVLSYLVVFTLYVHPKFMCLSRFLQLYSL